MGCAGLDPATVDDEEHLDRAAREFLTQHAGVAPTEAEVEKFKPLFLKARREGYGDVLRASEGDYSENPALKAVPNRTKPKVDLVEAFELYCSQPRIKGGLDGRQRSAGGRSSSGSRTGSGTGISRA